MFQTAAVEGCGWVDVAPDSPPPPPAAAAEAVTSSLTECETERANPHDGAGDDDDETRFMVVDVYSCTRHHPRRHSLARSCSGGGGVITIIIDARLPSVKCQFCLSLMWDHVATPALFFFVRVSFFLTFIY